MNSKNDLIRTFTLGLFLSRNQVPIRNRCAELNVKILRKKLISNVPLKISSEREEKDGKILHLLLDDDALIRNLWTITARKKGIKFKAYARWDELREVLSAVEKIRFSISIIVLQIKI